MLRAATSCSVQPVGMFAVGAADADAEGATLGAMTCAALAAGAADADAAADAAAAALGAEDGPYVQPALVTGSTCREAGGHEPPPAIAAPRRNPRRERAMGRRVRGGQGVLRLSYPWSDVDGRRDAS